MSEIAYISNDRKGGYLEDVVFKRNGRAFVLGVPDEVLRQAEEMGISDISMFTENTSPVYYGCENLAELEDKVGIEGFAQRVEASTMAVSANLIAEIHKIETQGGNLRHNGLKYGVSTVIKGASSDGQERLKLTIGLHDTTYLTFLIMNHVYAGLRKDKHPEFDDNRLRLMPRPDDEHDYAVMFNSLGINTSVLVNGPSSTTHSYVFAQRIDGNQLHLAMNEGLHPSHDIAHKQTFTLAALYERGMKEELGLTDVERFHKVRPRVHEMFIWASKGQPAIHAVTSLNMTIDELREYQKTAKDHDENYGLLAKPFNPLGLSFVKKEGVKIVPYVPELITNLMASVNYDL